MNKEEIKKQIEECEEKLKSLREELNKPEHGGKRWKPKKGERYWYVAMDGEIRSAVWTDDTFDRNLFSIGNMFPTIEAAEFEVERRKVVAELSDFAEGDDAVWDGYRRHYCIAVNLQSNNMLIDYWFAAKLGNMLYFPTKEAAEAAIAAVGEDRVRKYYLGIKEN